MQTLFNRENLDLQQKVVLEHIEKQKLERQELSELRRWRSEDSQQLHKMHGYLESLALELHETGKRLDQFHQKLHVI